MSGRIASPELRAPDADQLARYALGELPPDDEAAFEAALLDDDAWAAVQAAEDELLAAYAAGELTAARRDAIAARIAASPRLCERLAMIRDLQTIARRRRARGRRLAVAAAAVVALAAAIVLVLRGGGRGERATEIVALTLLPATRGGELPVVRVPAHGELALSIAIDAEEAFPRYRVRLRAARPSADAAAPWSRDDVVAAHGVLALRIPASAITEGIYQLEITGTGAGADVQLGARGFRVVR